jgi:hypothetical protein
MRLALRKQAPAIGAVLALSCTAPSSSPPSSRSTPKEDQEVERCLPSAAEPSAKVTRVSDLEEGTVIGKLGQPLGVVMRMEGTVVDGASLHDKVHSSSFLLRIDSVAGKPLDKPVVMDFEGTALPNSDFALHEWKTGKKTGQLDSRQIAELKVGYVGSRVTLHGYETGRFGGIPKCLPPDEMWQDRGFGFRTSLMVLRLLK